MGSGFEVVMVFGNFFLFFLFMVVVSFKHRERDIELVLKF